MKVYSQLEKAQLENTTSDVGSDPKGMVTYRTDTNVMKVSDGSAYREIVDVSTTQNLAGKTFTDAITGVQIATPANPAADKNKLYFKADNSLYTLTSGGVEQIVAGASPNSFSVVTKTANYSLVSTDHVVLADASLGGFTLTLAAPATVTGQKFIIKRTDNTLANVVSISGQIDGAINWKLHTQNETYEIISNGTEYKLINHDTDTAFSTPVVTTIYSSNNTFRLFCEADVAGSLAGKYITFETTNSGSLTQRYAWFKVGGVGVDPALVGKTGHMVTFAANATSGTIATAIAAVLNPLADINVLVYLGSGLQFDQVTKGAIDIPTVGNTGWSIAPSAVTPIAKGTTAIDKIYWRREGDSARIRLDYRQTTAGVAGLGDNLFLIPSGLIADSVLISPNPLEQGAGFGALQNSIVGFVNGSDSTAVNFNGGVYMFDYTHVVFSVTRNAGTSSGGTIAGGLGESGLNLVAVQYHAEFLIPIQDWKA